MNKVCAKCGLEKPFKDFYKDASKKTGRSSYCKECASEYQRTYRPANREKNIEYQRTYRPIYFLANRDKINKRGRANYLINKDRVNRRGREYNEAIALYSVYAHQLNPVESVYEDLDGKLLVPCAYCGKLHGPTTQAARNRVRSINGEMRGEQRLYCSVACKQACPSYHQKKYWKSQGTATSREVSAQFRQLVLERDSWTCQRCGAGIEAELHVHHIEGVIQQPGLANDLENGITLCKTCHKHVHSQGGCRYSDLRCPS